MDPNEFKQRTKAFASSVMLAMESLPKTRSSDIIMKQLLRSSMSVGANYRAACRAKSLNDMINKLKIVEEEADECLFWMELLIESKIESPSKMKPIYSEGNEILSMVVASLRTLRQRKAHEKGSGKS